MRASPLGMRLLKRPTPTGMSAAQLTIESTPVQIGGTAVEIS